MCHTSYKSQVKMSRQNRLARCSPSAMASGLHRTTSHSRPVISAHFGGHNKYLVQSGYTVNMLFFRNASRLALESREAMFRRAMTLLSARCTSVKQGVDAGDSNAPFGIQVPKYFYVTQEKPFPMEPLKVSFHSSL